MAGLKKFLLMLLFLSLGFPLSAFAVDESITVTTYYPSPYGVYKEMRAQRMAIGDNYISGSAYCWEGSCTTTINSAADLVVEGNVGIGTTSPGYKLQVGVAGDGTEARANAWNLLSDILLKTNLVRLDGALDKISHINGYYFNWKEGTDKRRHVGVISQEVEKVLPEVVSIDPEGYKSIDYGKLVLCRL